MRVIVAICAFIALAGCHAAPKRATTTTSEPKKMEPAKKEPAKPGTEAAKTGENKPAQPGDDADQNLALMLDTAKQRDDSAKQRQETAEQASRRKLVEENRQNEERLKKIDADRQAVAAGSKPPAAGDDNPIFEERYSEIISQVRQSLQKYKQW